MRHVRETHGLLIAKGASTPCDGQVTKAVRSDCRAEVIAMGRSRDKASTTRRQTDRHPLRSLRTSVLGQGISFPRGDLTQFSRTCSWATGVHGMVAVDGHRIGAAARG